MNLFDASLLDLIGGSLGLILTLFVFSYVFGDNSLFRLAIHILIGVSAAFVAVIILYNVIWPQLISPLIFTNQVERLMLVIPLILCILLFTKVSPRLALLGNPVLAYLVGIGAAAAIGGSVLGTIFPQVSATINYIDLRAANLSSANVGLQFINGSIILVGTLSTLIYFQFGVKNKGMGISEKPLWLKTISWIGQVFIAVTLGAIFAGVFAAALTALIERCYFIIQFINQIFPVFI